MCVVHSDSGSEENNYEELQDFLTGFPEIIDDLTKLLRKESKKTFRTYMNEDGEATAIVELYNLAFNMNNIAKVIKAYTEKYETLAKRECDKLIDQ